MKWPLQRMIVATATTPLIATKIVALVNCNRVSKVICSAMSNVRRLHPRRVRFRRRAHIRFPHLYSAVHDSLATVQAGVEHNFPRNCQFPPKLPMAWQSQTLALNLAYYVSAQKAS